MLIGTRPHQWQGLMDLDIAAQGKATLEQRGRLFGPVDSVHRPFAGAELDAARRVPRECRGLSSIPIVALCESRDFFPNDWSGKYPHPRMPPRRFGLGIRRVPPGRRRQPIPA